MQHIDFARFVGSGAPGYGLIQKNYQPQSSQYGIYTAIMAASLSGNSAALAQAATQEYLILAT
jgi:hypothetical protein